jgi:hypothetical protein
MEAATSKRGSPGIVAAAILENILFAATGQAQTVTAKLRRKQ